MTSDSSAWFEIGSDLAVFRPTGSLPLESLVGAVTEAITLTRTSGLCKLLVDLSVATGFSSPSVAERFLFINRWAEAAGGRVKLAVVAQPEMIDAGRFGVLAAANAGMRAEVFSEEADAVGWLRSGG